MTTEPAALRLTPEQLTAPIDVVQMPSAMRALRA